MDNIDFGRSVHLKNGVGFLAEHRTGHDIAETIHNPIGNVAERKADLLMSAEIMKGILSFHKTIDADLWNYDECTTSATLTCDSTL